MAVPRVLLVHGAATTSAVWDGVLPLLADLDPLVPERPCTGDLKRETEFLRELATGAVVVGVGGGATLGLALLAAGVAVTGALLHEPAAGSLVPGLLDHVVAGYDRAGVTGMAAALYGPLWTADLSPGPEPVARDLAMFRAFEPVAPVARPSGVLTTVGGLSGAKRHQAAEALEARFGITHRTLPGCAHAVHLERPDVLAAEVHALVRRLA